MEFLSYFHKVHFRYSLTVLTVLTAVKVFVVICVMAAEAAKLSARLSWLAG